MSRYDDEEYEDFLEWKRDRDRTTRRSRRDTRLPARSRRPARRDEPDDDDAVIVLGGARADAFIDRIFGDDRPPEADELDEPDGQADEPDPDELDEPDEPDEDEPTPDDPAPATANHRYFRSRR